MVLITEMVLNSTVVIDLLMTDDIYLSAYVNESHNCWKTNHERPDVEQITSNFRWETNSKRSSKVHRKHAKHYSNHEQSVFHQEQS